MTTKKARGVSQWHADTGNHPTVLVGTLQYGSDPSSNDTAFQAPPRLREAVRYQPLNTNWDGAVHANHVNGAFVGAIAPKTGDFTVADNDFSTGVALLILGEFELTSNIDYAIGGTTTVTADNMVVAISRLPGFSASNVGAVVTVEFSTGPASEVEFRASHRGTVTNFTPLDPATGFMGNGGPGVSAPVLT